jgi:hypothetical protein
MARKKMAPIHPGKIFQEEFLRPLSISQYRLAKDIVESGRRASLLHRSSRLPLMLVNEHVHDQLVSDSGSQRREC